MVSSLVETASESSASMMPALLNAMSSRPQAVSAAGLPRARVRFTELVEPETYVHLAGDFSGVDPGDPDAPPRDTLVARVRSDRTFAAGEEVALEIGGTGLHLFDLETGRTLR